MSAGSLLAKRLFIDYPRAGVKLTALGQTCRPIGKPASSPGKEFCLNYQKTLIHRLDVIDRRHLENVFTGVAEIYIASLLWLRLQTASTETTKPEDIRGNGEELPGLLSRRMEKLAHRLEPANFLELGSTQSQSDADERFVGDGSGRRESSDSCGLKTVVRALAKVETLLSAAKKGG